ncbi:MAG: DUF4040 domain-containing protein [Erysipelotrichaceae bacterium]|nr:DUF4040 domain-containing protein [Erysipelotrichaceae bacterium]
MILDLFYLSLIVFAILAVQSRSLRNAVIYLAVFSLVCSIVYLLLNAPDVAIAEATIGCTLSTILYLVALKKYKIFTVYYNCYFNDESHLAILQKERDQIHRILRDFAVGQELQLDLINTATSFTKLKESVTCDVVIFHSPSGIWLHGIKNSYQYQKLLELLKNQEDLVKEGKFIEGEDWSDEDNPTDSQTP